MAISCRNYRLRTDLFVSSVAALRAARRGRRALRSVYRTFAVGRDHWARRCRNYRLRTDLFVSSVCRFAGGGDISPPTLYNGADFAKLLDERAVFL